MQIPAEERKVVSVLFCDLVGFTAAAEAADPEDVRTWLVPYHNVLRATIEDFGGTVEKFAGDAILAVFGAPTAHEDDAERAVRAGLAIVDELARLDTPRGPPEVRVGINTGAALVALDARPEAGDAFVTGNVVNTAARLQASAPPGSVVVGEGTHRATTRVFTYEPLEPVSAKGLTAPLSRWRAGHPRARLGVDVIRNLTTPLVGRGRDFTLLRIAFEKAAAERTVQFVTLVGEPGIGKSRLVAELGADLDRREELITWRVGRCLPYGEGPFWPLAEIIKAHAGILQTDRAEDAAAKLDAVLPQGLDRAWVRARVLPLFGLEPRVVSGMAGGASPDQEESFAAWRQVLESFAETGPAVVVLEDLHWAEDGLLAFVEYLADWASELPLLVLATARPELLERHPHWIGGRQNTLSIGLSRLSDAETGELFSALLAELAVSAGVRTDLLERAGGNPLYAEELVRTLRDSDVLEADGTLRAGAHVDLPEGIAALIAARLDALAPDRKSLLADAAVLGKVFWAEGVAVIGDRSTDEAVTVLHELARRELVRPVRQSSMAGQREYTFWHALTRDVSYGQIPRAGRAARHVAAATWLEDQYAARLADAADVLAYHLGTALDLAQATGDAAVVTQVTPRVRQYTRMAAERAMNLDATQALTLLDQALQLTPEGDPERPDVLARWGWAAFQTGQVEKGLEAYRQGVAGFEANGDVVGKARALNSSTYATSNMRQSLETIEEVVALLEPLGPSDDLVDAVASQAGVLIVAGRADEAIEAADRALGLAAERGSPIPQRALEARGFARVSLGDSGGLADMKAALTALIAAGAGRDVGITWLNYGISLSQIEGPAAAIATYTEARAFAARRRFTEVEEQARCTLLQPRIDTGQLAAVIEDCRAHLSEEGPAFLPLRRIEVLAALARALIERGDEQASAAAEEAYRLAVHEGWPDFIVIAAAPVALTRAAAADRAGVREVVVMLTELAELPNSPELPSRLPALTRAAVAVGELGPAAALADCIPPLLPIREYASVTARALLAEARGEQAGAAAGFADAAAGWSAFGNRLEHGYASLGLGRCTAGPEPRRARAALDEARQLFAGMAATAALAECGRLLSRLD